MWQVRVFGKNRAENQLIDCNSFYKQWVFFICMGITKLTALIIQNNKVDIDVYGNKDTGYGYHVSRMERENYRLLLSSKPGFDSDEKAREAGKSLISEIKSMDLT